MKNLLFFILIFHCSLFTFHCFSQDQRLIDSLETALKKAKHDTTKAKIFIRFSTAYLDNFPDKSMEYSTQALSISEKTGFKKGMGKAYYNIGVIHRNKGEYSLALENCKKSLKIWQEIGDKREIGSSYNMIGIILFDQGIYPEALKKYIFSLKINEEIGDKWGIANAYCNMGNIYHNQKNDPEALKYQFLGLKIREEIGDKKGIAKSRLSIGYIYTQQGNYTEALKNHYEALKIYEESGNKKNIAIAYAAIGNVHVLEGNYPEALKYYFLSLPIFKETGNKPSTATIFQNIGFIFFKQRKFEDASIYTQKALALAREVGLLENVKDCYENFARIDSANGDFRQAFIHYQLYLQVTDSLKKEETAKKLQQIEFEKKLLADSLKREEEKLKVEMVRKEQMHRQRVMKILLFSAMGVALVVSFSISRRLRYTRKAKTEIEKAMRVIEKEKERSENLLLNILPTEVVEEIKQDGRSKARTFSMVTVMFTDFKDFAAVSEKFSAELLVAEIDYCFSAFDNIIQKHAVEKIKTIGDAYLCVGGMPLLTATHAVDVVTAAIGIRDFMLERKKEQDAIGGISFELRLGVHTGPVVAGIVGVKKYAYDIWGDTVNIAARMEQNSEAGKINISGSTYKLVKDKFNCVYRGKIEAKNKGEVEMYFVETVSIINGTLNE